jgi:hypothetical protein
MLARKGSRWELYPHKVKYTQHNEEHEQWALPNKEWWTAFADKWEHTEIIGFTEVELSEEQLKRFEEVSNMPEDFSDIYVEYILNGTFPNEFPNTHPFMVIKANKNNERLEKENQLLKAQNQALADKTEFHDDVLTEMILAIYS